MAVSAEALLIGRRVCRRETALFAAEGASKSTTLNFQGRVRPGVNDYLATI